jgi:predicted RNA-binding Zn ribbon-like protein
MAFENRGQMLLGGYMHTRTRFTADVPAPSRAGMLDLVGSELALDFTNTSSGRGAPSHQEHLRAFSDVVNWAEHAKVVTPEDAAFIRSAVTGDPEESQRLFTLALQTRELVWAIASAMAEARAVPEELRQALTAAHAANLANAHMEVRGGAYIWAWSVHRSIASAILGPITLSALTLLMEKDLSRTKRCEGHECGWLFFDTTKNKTRRWCEMRVCGNRAKVRALRQRKSSPGVR